MARLYSGYKAQKSSYLCRIFGRYCPAGSLYHSMDLQLNRYTGFGLHTLMC